MKLKDNNSNNTQKVFEKIVEKLQTIVDNGEYEKFLKFQKSFRGYSFNNLILIFSQFPDATRVAGKSKWLKLKREPIKNAKKIWIVAPIPRTCQKKTTVIEDGKKTEKIETIRYNYYKYVYVYDISETIGEAIPLQVNKINNDKMTDFYNKLKMFSKVPIYEEKIKSGADGYYSPKKKIIVIEKDMSLDDKAATLLHEIAHSLYDDFDYKTDRTLSEVFVESIAYIVADYFGLDTSCCSFNYIAQWAKGEPKTVIDLGNKIQKCANEFIKSLEQYEIQENKLVA